MELSEIVTLLQDPDTRQQAMRRIAVDLSPIQGGGDEQSIDAATPSVEPPFSVDGVLLPDDVLAVLLMFCNLETLIAMKGACRRLLTLARRAFRHTDWLSAHATDAQHAMWVDTSYVESVLKVPGLRIQAVAVSDAWLAVGTADSVLIYSLPDTSGPTRNLTTGSVHALEIQESKLLCVAASGSEFQIWDLQASERQFTITPRSVEATAWSSGVLFVAEAEEHGDDSGDDGDDDGDGQEVAAESVAHLVLWNTASGHQIAEGTLQLGARDEDADKRVVMACCSGLLAVACTAQLTCWQVQPGNAAPLKVWSAEWSTASLPADETFSWELGFSDGRIVASHWPNTVSVWASSGVLLLKLDIKQARGVLLQGDVLLVPPPVLCSGVRSFDMRTGREFENRISLPTWDHAGGSVSFDGGRIAIASNPFFAGPNNNLWFDPASSELVDASGAPPSSQVLLFSLFHLTDPARVAEKLRERQLQRRVLQNVVFALDMFTEQKQQVATFVERLDMVKQQVNRHTDTIRHCVDNNFRPVIEQCTHLHKMIENIERIQGIPDVEGMDGMEDSISGALGLDLSRMVEAVATSAKEVMVISEEMQKTTDQVCDTAADCLHVAQNMKHTAENFELHAVDFFGVACRDDLGSPPELAAAVCRAEELVSEDGACGKLRAAASAMALAVDVQRRLVVQLEAATSAGHHRAVLLNPLPRFAPQLEACSSDGENKAAEVLAVETGDEEVVADARDQPTAPPASLALPPASEVGSTDDNEEEEEEIVRAVAKMIVTGATTKGDDGTTPQDKLIGVALAMLLALLAIAVKYFALR